MTRMGTTAPTTSTTPLARETTYALRVDGHLDDHWSDRLAGLRITRNGDGTSTLTGPVADQTQLHGILAGIRDIGVPLLELRAVGPSDAPAPSVGHPAALVHRLHTERLTLRPATAADADATWRFRVVIQLGHHGEGEIIGDLLLRLDDAWAQLDLADQATGTQAELGWVLDPRYTGHGYATEAVRELVRYCFEELGVRRVVATCFLANDASCR